MLAISSLGRCLFYQMKTNGDLGLTLELTTSLWRTSTKFQDSTAHALDRKSCVFWHTAIIIPKANTKPLLFILQKILRLTQGSLCTENH